MKPIFLLFFLSLGLRAKNLPPGTYHHLRPTEPMVLDTGSYTFLHLEMKDLGEGLWLDARKARQLTLWGCRFEGSGQGTALLSSGNLTVSHCRFGQMAVGIHQEVEAGTKAQVRIVHNLFSDVGTAISLQREALPTIRAIPTTPNQNYANLDLDHYSPDRSFGVKGYNSGFTVKNSQFQYSSTPASSIKPSTAIQSDLEEGGTVAIRLEGNTFRDMTTAIDLQRIGTTENAVVDFTLKCNQFKLTCAETNATACNTEPQRRGLVIGEGVRVFTNSSNGPIPDAIGGTQTFDATNPLIAHPNANEWPVVFGTNRAVFPTTSLNLQASWSSPVNWKSLENHSSNPNVIYRRYSNEFVTSQMLDAPPIQSSPTPTYVKTFGTPANPNIDFENTCTGFIDDPNPIFPARIAVVPDSQSNTSIGYEILKAGPWLGQAIPNPAQGKTKIGCFIPPSEEMAILQFVEFGTGKVLSAKAIAERGQLEIDIDLSQFAAGVYGCQVILKNQKLGAKRFVVIK